MNKDFNPHYDIHLETNKKTILQAQTYDKAFYNKDEDVLDAFEKEVLGSDGFYKVGTKVPSPWGHNTVLQASIGRFGKNEDIVKKEIIVNSASMLSLQRHRGRSESWTVVSGALTVILDGKLIEVPPEECIQIPKGKIHCMINRQKHPVTVIETQTGTCLEADNVRLLDFNNRNIIPIETVNEAQSAMLYSEIHEEIRQKFGCFHKPNKALLSYAYKEQFLNK